MSEEDRVIYINPDDVGKMWMTSPCKDPILNRIFQEEVEKLGLSDRKIELLTLEEPDTFPYEGNRLGKSGGSMFSGYRVELTISPNGVEDHIENPDGGFLDYLTDNIFYGRYYGTSFIDMFRTVARRELLLIKFGYRDYESAIGYILDLPDKLQHLKNLKPQGNTK